MLRIITEVKPAYVIGENVTGIINLALDEVLASLEDKGYTCETFVLPSCALNAPHRRDRVWIVAYSDCDGHQLRGFGENRSEASKGISLKKQRERIRSNIGGISKSPNIANPRHERPQKSEQQPMGIKQLCKGGVDSNLCSKGLQGSEDFGGIRGVGKESEKQSARFLRADWQNFPTQPPLCGRDDGIPGGLVRGYRTSAIKAYGNAIVPQVAYEIFKAIKEIEDLK